jgi:Zn-finger nucleic acid-binding protein
VFCPLCQEELEKTIFYGAEIDYCPKCLGLWFEEDELRLAKDKKDEELNWLDIDLWREKRKFRISRNLKPCPFCRLPLYEINYGKSNVKVDLCSLCSGIWLERGEFKRIIEYLKEQKDYEVLNNFNKRVIKEFWEIFIGPGTLREEMSDFLSVLKILLYKFSAQHPTFIKIIADLPPK